MEVCRKHDIAYDGGDCPVCSLEFDKEQLKDDLKDAKSEIKELEKRIEDLENEILILK